MGKILIFFDLLRKGAVVSQPALWKNRSALTLALTALILAGVKAAKGFGYELPITEADAATLAAGIAVLVGLFSTYATTDKVGIPGLDAAALPPVGSTGPVRAADQPAAPAGNAVDQHERAFPRDSGGGA